MNVPVSLQRLWIQMTADRKRFGVLCGALAVGLLLWGRVIIVTNVPRTAVAEPAAAASEKKTDASARSEPDRTRPRPSHVTVALSIDRLPSRDPFKISSKHFPQARDAAPIDTGKGFVEVVEDPEKAEARLVATLQGHVSLLKLEAVMSGVPMILINGRTYRLGDLIPVPGQADVMFELVEVNERSVVIEHQGRRFVLSMATPGLN